MCRAMVHIPICLSNKFVVFEEGLAGSYERLFCGKKSGDFPARWFESSTILDKK
jgi:hypothetical protein